MIIECLRNAQKKHLTGARFVVLLQMLCASTAQGDSGDIPNGVNQVRIVELFLVLHLHYLHLILMLLLQFSQRIRMLLLGTPQLGLSLLRHLQSGVGLATMPPLHACRA